jgi:Zn-dependent peptidase ImmA (M78 family)
MDESEFSGAPASVREVLFGRDDDSISGIGFGRSPATDEWLVHINPSHHVHRQRVTLMEEVVHIVLDHPKSQLTIDPRTGKWQRSFDKNVEEEAYGVGAACIIPYKALFFAIKYDHDVISTLAERYNVSEEYMYFRIKLSGLLNVYRKNSGPT